MIKSNMVMLIALSNVESLTKEHSSSLAAFDNAVIYVTSFDKQCRQWHSVSPHLISSAATGTVSPHLISNVAIGTMCHLT